MWRVWCLLVTAWFATPVWAGEEPPSSRISDVYTPVLDAATLQRPHPLLELGNPFQASGFIHSGFRLPGGAVWQPAVWVYGTHRTTLQAFDNGSGVQAEWANRLDLFANLQLTGTERVLVGVRPLDQNGRASGYQLRPSDTAGWDDALNMRLTTLFFEGELGELLPGLDSYEQYSLDWGFAVGRQPVFFQEGMLINDEIDAIGITRNTLLPSAGSNLRVTLLYGWNEINRDDNREDAENQLFGLFTESDWPWSTISADVVYLRDTQHQTDGVFWGLSGVQRMGHWNSSVRILGSHALDEKSAAVSTGYLFFSEFSRTLPWTADLIYANAFWGIDRFASASRGPTMGGPLGRTGILFAAVGLGQFSAVLSNRADRAVGAAIGYQQFFDDIRKQLIVELGGRENTRGEESGALALGIRYQHALGQRVVLQLDVFGAIYKKRPNGWGSRCELRYEF